MTRWSIEFPWQRVKRWVQRGICVTLKQENPESINLFTVCDVHHRIKDDDSVIFRSWSDAPHIERLRNHDRRSRRHTGVLKRGISRFELREAHANVCGRLV
ncbi:MAG: hypothetical protein ABR991_11915 [Terracidiphilus sp.]